MNQPQHTLFSSENKHTSVYITQVILLTQRLTSKFFCEKLHN